MPSEKLNKEEIKKRLTEEYEAKHPMTAEERQIKLKKIIKGCVIAFFTIMIILFTIFILVFGW